MVFGTVWGSNNHHSGLEKDLISSFVLWESSSHILLAWSHFLLILVYDLVRRWFACTRPAHWASECKSYLSQKNNSACPGWLDRTFFWALSHVQGTWMNSLSCKQKKGCIILLQAAVKCTRCHKKTLYSCNVVTLLVWCINYVLSTLKEKKHQVLLEYKETRVIRKWIQLEENSVVYHLF